MPRGKEKAKTTSLQISREDLDRLEEMARGLGHLQSTGAGAGKLGNISALVRAIANGAYRLVRTDEESRIERVEGTDVVSARKMFGDYDTDSGDGND